MPLAIIAMMSWALRFHSTLWDKKSTKYKYPLFLESSFEFMGSPKGSWEPSGVPGPHFGNHYCRQTISLKLPDIIKFLSIALKHKISTGPLPVHYSLILSLKSFLVHYFYLTAVWWVWQQNIQFPCGISWKTKPNAAKGETKCFILSLGLFMIKFFIFL